MLEALARISSGQRLSPTDEQNALNELELNECWQPLFRYLDQALAAGGQNQPAHYRRLIRLRLNYFEDYATAQALTSDMIRRCRLDFAGFRDALLNDQAIPGIEARQEAALLEAASDAFHARADRAQALEKLAVVYEKRLFNESRLQQVFERLLELDPDNIRALRYFRLAFHQNNDWEQVARILKRLINVVQARQEKFRLAQDLAYNLVYHMKQPRDALLILDRYCKDSPLDVSQIEFDAAYRIGDMDRCIQVLRGALRGVRDDAGKAIIQFRMAELFRTMGNLRDCESSLRQSLDTWSVFLDPFEALIQLQMDGKRWKDVCGSLRSLAGRVQDPELVAQIQQAASRIASGLGDQGP